MERPTSLREQGETRVVRLRARRAGHPGILCDGDQFSDGFAMLREWRKPENDAARATARHAYWRTVQVEDGEAAKSMLLKNIR